jgi:hypothetical protein
MLPGRRTFAEFIRALDTDDLDLLAIYKPLAGRRIVITGALDGCSREEFTRHLFEWGASVDSGVRSSTDWLLAVDPERMTAKRKQAAAFGVTVLDEYGFTRMLHTVLHETEKAADLLAATVVTAPVPPPVWFADDPDLLPDGDEQDDPDFSDAIVPLSSPGA